MKHYTSLCASVLWKGVQTDQRICFDFYSNQTDRGRRGKWFGAAKGCI